jgi:hypothetical protein
MRIVIVAVVLIASAVWAPAARAANLLKRESPYVRTATHDLRGNVVPGVARVQPVIGSVQRTGHFTNPFTHKTRYTGTVFNPLNGTFGKQTYKR